MKSTAAMLIASLLFLILSPGLSRAFERRHVARVEHNVGAGNSPPSTGGSGFKQESKDHRVRDIWSHEKLTRVRVEAPLISKGPIIGRFIRTTQDTLIVRTERGQEERMPLSLVENFEVSIKRTRNTAKGIMTGIVLTGAYLFPGVLLDEANILNLRSTTAAIFLTSAVLGVITKSDQWMAVSPYRLRPSAAITHDRGVAAALRFDF
ncbi:MAG: hypothetical protein OXU79_21260 [Gemmatimonadota bacterium]|nr:hypothetical protein [Gemmatimonadota bacterium]